MSEITNPKAEPSFLARFKKCGMSRQFALAPLLLPAVPLAAAENIRTDTSYQVYDEANGRITVESWYFRGEMFLDEATTFRFQYLNDAIAGASPTGALPGGPQPFLADLDDVRKGVLGALARQFGDHRVELEFSRSQEQDYLSYGVSLSDRWELNQKNTTLSMGLNYLDDRVKVIGLADQPKKSCDVFAGISQLLDKNTILKASLTLGYSEGYLNDPYKAIQRTDIISVGGMNIPTVNLYRENRPDNRFRTVLQMQGTRFFEKYHAALDTTVRLSKDTYRVFSQSAQIEWRQAIGDKFEVTPFFRCYRQNAADFFYNSLDELPTAAPADFPMGAGPNYSADYRLSSMSTMSLGLKAKYQVNDHFALSVAYEHYDMTGIGSRQAPAASYPTASMWTFGVTVEF